MNTDERAVRDLLAPLDPAAAVRVDADQRARARVDALAMGGARTPGARIGASKARWRLAALGAAACAAALAMIGVLAVNPADSAYAGPPPAPLSVTPANLEGAREELLALAETAEARPEPAPAGDVAYVRTAQWTLTWVQDADTDEFGWGIAPVDHQVWRSASQDAGYSVEAPQPAEHLSGDADPVLSLFEQGPSESDGMDEGLAMTWEPGELATDPGALEAQLPEIWDTDSTSTATLFSALQELYGERPVTPAEQGAVLRMLAGRDDVRFAGEATDREGRSGLLFLTEDTESVEGGLLQRRVMFAPDTGMPLYHETVLMESDAPTPGELPQVNNYTVLVASAWVAEVKQIP
ncbi:CU044_5270 family protein [Actinorugispora endophytica]|uniref:CU044_5270 family protein n=1 Tax=Actinorugispora endophytica TaxID=1605990 RepID=A0A4R6UFE8_9ACTN|nr:CU044_5270 family protein [Actinorugispora endophytica]TDQ45491.1 hypothetical protein EV190_1318 [Actinorugispora endophytica]